MNARCFSAKFGSNNMASRKASTLNAVSKGSQGAEIDMTGNMKVNQNNAKKTGLRSPKEYMFARSDFSVEKAKLDEVLDTGVLFRYHEPNPENIPCAKLEQAFCEKFGFKYALGVNSASSGLLLSLLASGVQPGDSVLMPAFTFVAVPSSIVLSGANPVLVEINSDYALDPDHLEEQIAKYNPKWLMLSYMRGTIPDLDRILEICSKHNITLIEDTAHAMGVKWNGQ
jgi:perosamine synthetase